MSYNTILGKMPKTDKKLLTDCKILTFKRTFRDIQSNPSYDMLLMSSQRGFKLKKKQEASRPDSSAKLIRYLAAGNRGKSGSPSSWPDSTVEKFIKKEIVLNVDVCVTIGLFMCLYLWALMLRVGRSVVVGHSGGCHCPGDRASLQARTSFWRGWAVARVGTGSLSRVVQQWCME